MSTDNDKVYQKIREYVHHNPLATLSTVSIDGSPHGAIVYISPDIERYAVYFLTKRETRKFKNLVEHAPVSLTFVNPIESSTLQIEGSAYEVSDIKTINAVMKDITSSPIFAGEWMPPVSKLHAGTYVIVGVELLHARLAQFKGASIGNENIFTTL